MTNFGFMRKRLLDRSGLGDPPIRSFLKLEDLELSEWSPRFEQLMRNRLLIGALRYGLINAPGKPSYDRIAGARKRLLQYQETGNLECLVDVANMALLEFEEGNHQRRHFRAMNGDHCCPQQTNPLPES